MAKPLALVSDATNNTANTGHRCPVNVKLVSNPHNACIEEEFFFAAILSLRLAVSDTDQRLREGPNGSAAGHGRIIGSAESLALAQQSQFRAHPRQTALKGFPVIPSSTNRCSTSRCVHS